MEHHWVMADSKVRLSDDGEVDNDLTVEMPNKRKREEKQTDGCRNQLALLMLSAVVTFAVLLLTRQPIIRPVLETPRASTTNAALPVFDTSSTDVSCYEQQKTPSTQDILFVSDRTYRYGAGYMLRMSDRTVCRISPTVGGVYSIAWSPDKSHIAYADARGIWITPTDGSSVPQLLYPGVTNDSALDWSPDGSRIIYATTALSADGNLDIALLPINGTAPQPLTTDPSDDYSPTWSSDGTSILFTSERDGNPEIYVMGADGIALRRLTDNPAVDDHASWSPNGERILFTSDRDGDREIYSMNADGKGVLRVTISPLRDDYPRWIDDTTFVFVSYRDGNNNLYRMSANGSDLQPLTQNLSDDSIPAFQ
jgi:Tol biopolymer transport system component